MSALQRSSAKRKTKRWQRCRSGAVFLQERRVACVTVGIFVFSDGVRAMAALIWHRRWHTPQFISENPPQQPCNTPVFISKDWTAKAPETKVPQSHLSCAECDVITNCSRRAHLLQGGWREKRQHFSPLGTAGGGREGTLSVLLHGKSTAECSHGTVFC